MLVPTLPASRFLILDDADLPACVSVALASERGMDPSGGPVLVPSWWRDGADDAMPLVHRSVERHASVYGAGVASAELVIEPSSETGLDLSQLLLAAVPLALEHGCDAVLFPVRPDGVPGSVDLPVDGIAREVDRAELIARLAALDTGSPCPIVTPMVDLTDRQVIDLAADMGVSNELCWWHGMRDEPVALESASRWKRPVLVAAASEPDAGAARTG